MVPQSGARLEVGRPLSCALHSVVDEPAARITLRCDFRGQYVKRVVCGACAVRLIDAGQIFYARHVKSSIKFEARRSHAAQRPALQKKHQDEPQEVRRAEEVRRQGAPRLRARHANARPLEATSKLCDYICHHYKSDYDDAYSSIAQSWGDHLRRKTYAAQLAQFAVYKRSPAEHAALIDNFKQQRPAMQRKSKERVGAWRATAANARARSEARQATQG